MSGRDEQDDAKDKVTVLFPDAHEEGDGTRSGREAGDEEETAAQGDTGEESDDEAQGDAGSNSGDEADVVRIDFGGDDRRSLREVVVDAEESDEDVAHTKYEIFRRMIEDGMVMVTLDTRCAGVDVPPKFEDLPELRLNFSHLFPIDDFDYDDKGVRASLSFEGTRYFCDVPWEAVFMLYSHETGDVVVFEPRDPS